MIYYPSSTDSNGRASQVSPRRREDECAGNPNRLETDRCLRRIPHRGPMDGRSRWDDVPRDVGRNDAVRLAGWHGPVDVGSRLLCRPYDDSIVGRVRSTRRRRDPCSGNRPLCQARVAASMRHRPRRCLGRQPVRRDGRIRRRHPRNRRGSACPYLAPVAEKASSCAALAWGDRSPDGRPDLELTRVHGHVEARVAAFTARRGG